MTALFHDSGIPSWLSPTPLQFDYCEERIAELVESKRTVVALGAGWWLYPQINMISDKHQQRIRCGYSAHNWHLYMRSGWYWAKQNTGRMDASGPPVSLAKAPKAEQGGNFSVAEGVTSHKGNLARPELSADAPAFLSRSGAEEARQPHKLEVGRSNRSCATDVLPDRCGYAHQPVGSRPDFADQRHGQQVPRKGF